MPTPIDEIDESHTYYASAFGIGIAAAAVMALVTWLCQVVGLTEFDLAMSLGTASVFTDAPSPGAWFQGFLVMLICGGCFALVYAAVFESWGYKARAWEGALVGIVHGVAGGAMLGWLMPPLHPDTMSGSLLANPGFMGMNYGLATGVVFLGLHVIFGAVIGGWMHYSPLARRHLDGVAARHVHPPSTGRPTPV